MKNRQTTLIKIISLLIISLLIVLVFSSYVPYNMDEFGRYHRITCLHYDYNYFSEFRSNCSVYDLNILNTGIILPVRATYYTGSFSSLYYYPLFLLWKSPLSARFLGIIFLIIQAFILSRIFRIKTEYIFFGLLAFFPYFFQHIVDTGPVQYQIASIYLLYLISQKWVREPKTSVSFLIAVILFLGVWSKLSYLWLFPGIFIIFLIHFIEYRDVTFKKSALTNLAGRTLVLLVMLAGLLSILFLSSKYNSPSDYPYLNQILNSARSKAFTVSQLFDEDLMGRTRVFQAFINPFEATQRIYYAHQPSKIVYLYDFFIYLTIPVISILLLFITGRDVKRGIIKPNVLLLTFILTFFMILRTKAAWGMHHVILASPFLVLGLLSLFDSVRRSDVHMKGNISSKKILATWVLLFLLLSSYFFINFGSQHVRSHDDISKVKVNRILSDERLAKNYIYVIIDWGMYYYQGLYGDDEQSVIHILPFDNDAQVKRLMDLSEESGRRLLFIYNSSNIKSPIDSNLYSKLGLSDIAFLRRSFDLQPCSLVDKGSVWKVLLETDDEGNICM